MQDYELLYVVSGEETEEASTKVTDEVNAALLKMGGKVTNEDTWGRRRLAYEIDKQDHGWYTVTRFSLDGDKTAEFTNQLRLNGKIVRTVLLKAEELPTEEEIARAEEAAAARETRSKERAVKPAPTPDEPKEPKKAETAEEKKERQAKLEAQLERLKEEG
jgi:small subunit ribosomal protein S6